MAHDGHSSGFTSRVARNTDVPAGRVLNASLLGTNTPMTPDLRKHLVDQRSPEATIYIQVRGAQKRLDDGSPVERLTQIALKNIAAEVWQGPVAATASEAEQAKGVICVKGDPIALAAVVRKNAEVCGLNADDLASNAQGVLAAAGSRAATKA